MADKVEVKALKGFVEACVHKKNKSADFYISSILQMKHSFSHEKIRKRFLQPAAMSHQNYKNLLQCFNFSVGHFLVGWSNSDIDFLPSEFFR